MGGEHPAFAYGRLGADGDALAVVGIAGQVHHAHEHRVAVGVVRAPADADRLHRAIEVVGVLGGQPGQLAQGGHRTGATYRASRKSSPWSRCTRRCRTTSVTDDGPVAANVGEMVMSASSMVSAALKRTFEPTPSWCLGCTGAAVRSCCGGEPAGRLGDL